MRPGQLSDGSIQEFYFPENHPTMPGLFKSMEQIIKEHGKWPKDGLKAQCDGFKCESGKNDCCCRVDWSFSQSQTLWIRSLN